ncbi:HET-domain-containing protein [Setomelanomma holmii]|uniref:HET-domain-containing protein n=1 Tax=Setomelanomma holmii TaxID=210430 RepID=A0A9P4HKS2_9PLEO|nr:HET-domain-containing protein [Setomelanomma holmii]
MIPGPTNRLCDVCSRVVKILSTPGWHRDLLHHESRASLERSASSNCGICTLLLEQVSSVADKLSIDTWEELAFPVRCDCDTSAASFQRLFELRLSCPWEGTHDRISLTFVLEQVEVDTGKSSEHAPPASTSSPQCQTLAKQWLHECTQFHERCNATVPQAWAPSRVLDVGSNDEDDCRIWLVMQDRKQYSTEGYATLSHCWGQAQMIQLTRSNMAEFCHTGIRREALPKTFRDAIEIARYLGIRHLWIDALCIVQDDVEDWRHEADLMSKVYRYCSINIAATGGSGSDAGCFWERCPETVQRTQVEIKWSDSTISGPLTYCVIPEPKLWRRQLLDEPLNRRCWVVQERILSPRTLHFGRQQLSWECREHIACETFHRGLPKSLLGDTFINIKTLELGDETEDDRWPAFYVARDTSIAPTLSITESFRPIVQQVVTLHATKRSAAVYRDWDSVIELYSRASLTFATDRLVAISGIAQALVDGDEGFRSDGYLAGLWHSSLPCHLLWKTANIREAHRPPMYEEYIAPSWSWASIGGEVSFEWCQRDFDKNDYLAVMEDAEVLTHGEYRFGQVRAGRIKLLAPLASCCLTSNAWIPSLKSFSTGIKQISQPGSESLKATIMPDFGPGRDHMYDRIFLDIPQHNEPEEVLLLPIIGTRRKTAHDTEAVFALILRKATQEEFDLEDTFYVRIGFCYTDKPQVCRILRNMQRRSVTII